MHIVLSFISSQFVIYSKIQRYSYLCDEVRWLYHQQYPVQVSFISLPPVFCIALCNLFLPSFLISMFVCTLPVFKTFVNSFNVWTVLNSSLQKFETLNIFDAEHVFKLVFRCRYWWLSDYLIANFLIADYLIANYLIADFLIANYLIADYLIANYLIANFFYLSMHKSSLLAFFSNLQQFL